MTPEAIFGAPIPKGAIVLSTGAAASCFIPISDDLWEAHYAALPGHRGLKACADFKGFLRDFWAANPTVKELIGAIDAHNRPARHLASRLGFSLIEVRPVPWPNDEMRETAHYRMTRP